MSLTLNPILSLLILVLPLLEYFFKIISITIISITIIIVIIIIIDISITINITLLLVSRYHFFLETTILSAW